ncbi:MAG TPA: hypothetical protein DCL48_03990 [Alphaproteobacteria bacterium]|nr:hypothetical protein [Alphaproteobacteria bacterium]HBK55644.1 hypothetical protein [Xanthomonadales bacterium]
MTITLSPSEQAWIADALARGHFSTEDAAVRALLARGMAAFDDEALAAQEQDPAEIARLRALLAAADAEIDQGLGIPLEEHNARMRAILNRLQP